MTTTITTKNKEDILTGLNKAANIVTSTMGGQGKTVIISDKSAPQMRGNYLFNPEALRFTKDGVSVARSIKFENDLENIGAQILLSAANKTVEECGDGTTLTSLLLQKLIQEVNKSIRIYKDVNTVLQNTEGSIAQVIKYLQDNSKQVTSPKEVQFLAATSSNSERIGLLFKEIYESTGLDALITLEKSEQSDRTYFEITNGISFDNGYVHPVFMTNKDTEQAIYENCYVHIDTEPISSVNEFYRDLLSISMKEDTPIAIIAPRFSDAFVRACSMNKTGQGAKVVLIKTPGYGYGVVKNVEDIKAFLSDTNYVDKIVVNDRSFFLYNEDTPNLQPRLDQLLELSKSAHDKFDEEDYKNRYFKLKNSSAVIYAGGQTPESMQEEYDRIEDAIGAVNAAIKGGYVEGGGLALFRAFVNLDVYKPVKNILKAPIIKILENANIKEVQIDIEDIKGYNVKTHRHEDFYETGVIDPTNVIISALKNAFTNTKLLVNTSYTLVNDQVT